MNTVVLLTILSTILFGVYLYFETDYDFMVFLLNLSFGLLCFLLSFVVTCMISLIPYDDVSYNLQSEQKLLALQDNNSTQGSFFLGSGNVDGAMKYVYLIEKEDGVQMQTINVQEIIIVEEDNCNPRILTYAPEFKNKNWNNWAWVLKENKVKIFIPKGSIKYNYNVDLK